MKQVYKSELPKCDFCKIQPAHFDAPTTMGPWANMCDKCYGEKASSMASLVGYELVQSKNAAPKQGAKLYAKRISEDEVECPGCGAVRGMEPDAEGTFNCEECGQLCYCKDVMDDMGFLEEGGDIDE